MTTAALLSDLQRQGFILIPLPEDKLAVKPAETLTDALREALRQHKGELLALLSQPAPSWPCPHCGQEAEMEDVVLSLDGQRLLTLWNCQPCQAWAVTPSGITPPPSGWVKKTPQ